MRDAFTQKVAPSGFPFLCGVCTGELVALALASILWNLCSSCVEPTTSESAVPFHAAQSRISHRIPVSRIVSSREFCAGLVGQEICWVSIGGDSTLVLEGLGKVVGLYDVTVQSDPETPSNWNRSWMPRVMMISWHWSNSAGGESLMQRRRLNLVVNREPFVFHFLDW